MNETNDYFIRKTLQKYLIPTIFSILGTTTVGFINTILAGQFLGKEALTAMNLLSSFTFLFAMLGCMISIGASARASVAMGMGDENAVGAGLPGVAWATVISTAVADLLGILFLFFGKNRQIRPVFPGVKRILSLTGSVCRAGAASGLNNLCNMLRTDGSTFDRCFLWRA